MPDQDRPYEEVIDESKETVLELFSKLSPDERADFFCFLLHFYCQHCGSEIQNYQCPNCDDLKKED